MVDYTKEQAEAVFNLDDDIILEAGAGSGKTRVLVGRYLYLLESHRAENKDILAITFTNKAANEMMERIREEMLEKSQQGNLEEKKFWYNKLLKLNQAQIGTFHSFAGRILRENPVAAGLDPDFKILDEEEANRILSEIITEVIKEGLVNQDENLMLLAREYGLFNLNTILGELYFALQKTSLHTGLIMQRTANYLKELKGEFVNYKGKLIEVAEDLIATYEREGASGKSREKMEDFKRNWPRIRIAIQEIKGIEEEDKLMLIEGIPEIIKGRLAKSINDLAKTLREMIKDNTLIAYLILGLVEKIVKPIGEIVKRIEERYQGVKKERIVLDFADLENNFVQLLKENPELLVSLQGRFSYLMVDEFQDNSPRQEGLINLLAGSDKLNLFLVGDPKQSIYRFRGADVRVFNRQRDKIINLGGKDLKLTKNFRSRQSILAFANFIFSRLMNKGIDKHFVQYQSLEAQRSGGEENLELLLIDREGLAEDNYRKEEAYLLAERINKLIFRQGLEIEDGAGKRPLQYGDIAILFQSLSNVMQYEEALQAYHIPYIVVNGRGFYEQQEFIDILNLLKVIDNHQRLISLVGLLRSPFCGLSDEDLYYLSKGADIWQEIDEIESNSYLSSASKKQLVKLRELIKTGRKWKDSLSTVELINRLLDKSNYLAALAANPYYQQQKANLRKLFKIIEGFYQDNLPSLRDVIDFLEEKREKYNREGLALVEQEGSNLVQLMSIHQAKGLEFPVVILPDCQRQVFNPHFVSSVLLDEERGLGIRVRYHHKKRDTQPSPLYTELFQQERIEEIAESQRLFYVAITRARDYLIISGAAKNKLKCSELLKGKSWLDWLAWAFDRDLLQLTEEQGEGLLFKDGDFTGKLRVRIINEERKKEIKLEDEIAVSTEFSLPSLTDWDHKEEWFKIAPLAGPVPWIKNSKKPTLSVTSLMVYHDCPRKYYLRYRRGLPEYEPIAKIRDDNTLTSEDNALTFEDKILTPKDDRDLNPAEKGILVHRICELSSQGKDIDDLLVQLGQEMGFKDDSICKIKDEVLAMVKSYLERDRLRRLNYGEIKEEKREQGFLLKFPRFRLGGQIDQLIKFNDHSAEIIDLKTNRLTKAGLEKKSRYYQCQLEAYALAVYKIWGLVPIKAKLDFLMPGLESEFDFQKEDLLKLEDKFLRLGEKIISLHGKDDFPLVKSDSCRYCQYGYLCSRNINMF